MAQEPAALPPRALIVTLLGLYARETGGWLSVALLVKLMGYLGTDEAAVRSSISRLKRRGVIEAQRLDRSAGYTVSAQARHILELGDRRIFQRQPTKLSDGWLLAVFSVPEAERDKRHVLRSRLAWLGFGTVSAGIWIAPAHLEDEARDVLTRERLAGYVDLFSGDHRGFDDLRDKVARWWNLAELDDLYSDFQRRHVGVLAWWASRPYTNSDDRDAFVDYIRTLTTWRRLPYLDPGLPAELLPDQWAGTGAADTFAALQARLQDPAHRFVASLRAET